MSLRPATERRRAPPHPPGHIQQAPSDHVPRAKDFSVPSLLCLGRVATAPRYNSVSVQSRWVYLSMPSFSSLLKPGHSIIHCHLHGTRRQTATTLVWVSLS